MARVTFACNLEDPRHCHLSDWKCTQYVPGVGRLKFLSSVANAGRRLQAALGHRGSLPVMSIFPSEEDEAMIFESVKPTVPIHHPFPRYEVFVQVGVGVCVCACDSDSSRLCPHLATHPLLLYLASHELYYVVSKQPSTTACLCLSLSLLTSPSLCLRVISVTSGGGAINAICHATGNSCTIVVSFLDSSHPGTNKQRTASRTRHLKAALGRDRALGLSRYRAACVPPPPRGWAGLVVFGPQGKDSVEKSHAEWLDGDSRKGQGEAR